MSESIIIDPKQLTITEKEILKISTYLQCDLIRKLVVTGNNDKLLSDLLKDITQKAHASLNADACSIFVNNKENMKSFSAAGTGHYETEIGNIWYPIKPPDEVPPLPNSHDEKLGLTGWIISTGRSFISSKMDDLNNHPHHIGQGIPKGKELSAFLGVPLRTPQGIINGAIKVERYKPSHEFDTNEQIFLENFAQIAGRCIAHVHDAAGGIREKNAAVIAWALDIIAEAVSSEEELDAFLNIIVRLIAAASNADACSIYLIDESKKTLTQRAGVGSQGLQKGIRSYRLPESDPVLKETISNLNINVKREDKIGITPWIAYTEKSHYAKNFNELRKHPHHTGKNDKINFLANEQCGCWYGVPVRIAGSTIGVLKIENISQIDKVDNREFSVDIRNRVDSLSQNIALAIERSQFRIKSGTNILQDASKTIFKILRGNTGVKELVSNVVQETAKLFNAKACALFLKEGRKLIQPEWAAVGWALKGEKVRKYNLVELCEIRDYPEEDEKVGLTVWIAVKNTKFSARSNLELTMHPHHRETFDKMNFIIKDERCESFMGVPLYVGEELIGVLKVETKMSRDQKEFTYFSEQDELAFEFIANSAAIAIQNSRLIEANVLADRILVQHDNTNVLRELYEFISGRVEWVNTLSNTKSIVSSKNPEKARIIENFAGLLEPDFRLFALEQIITLIGDEKTKSFFEFVFKACQATALKEIMAFDIEGLMTFNLDRNHFLYENAVLLSDISGKVRNNLRHYNTTVETRYLLNNVKEILSDKSFNERIERMNPFDVHIIKRIIKNIERVVDLFYTQFHKVTSPYRAGMPLEPNSKLFFGRGDIFKWIETKINTNMPNVLVLHGGSRTGKTSILKQLDAGQLGANLRDREESPIYPVFIDLHAFADCTTEIFLLTLAEKIWEKHKIFKKKINRPDINDYKSGYHFRSFEQFIKEVTDLLFANKKSILVIMLDEFETIEELVNAGKIDKSIYRYLRSQMQHQQSITFILAGHYRLDELKNAQNDIILNIADHKEVSFLNKVETEKLIVEPVKSFAIEYKPEIISKIYSTTNGHPFFVQQICNNCIEILNDYGGDYSMTDKILNEAIEKSIDPGSVIVLNELWNSADLTEQTLLRHITEKISPGNEWVDVNVLKNNEINSRIENNTIVPALEKLHKKQLILFDYPSNKVKFAFDLFRLYIVKHRLRNT